MVISDRIIHTFPACQNTRANSYLSSRTQNMKSSCSGFSHFESKLNSVFLSGPFIMPIVFSFAFKFSVKLNRNRILIKIIFIYYYLLFRIDP